MLSRLTTSATSGVTSQPIATLPLNARRKVIVKSCDWCNAIIYRRRKVSKSRVAASSANPEKRATGDVIVGSSTKQGMKHRDLIATLWPFCNLKSAITPGPKSKTHVLITVQLGCTCWWEFGVAMRLHPAIARPLTSTTPCAYQITFCSL
jgi:hypothetical protein